MTNNSNGRQDVLRQLLLASMDPSNMNAQAGYEEFLRLLLKETMRYGATRLKNSSDVDDFTQEVLLAVHRARHTYDRRLDFFPWYFAIMKYKLVDIKRRRAKYRSRVETNSDSLDSMENGMEGSTYEGRSEEKRMILRQLIERALSTLSSRERSIVKTVSIEDRKLKTAAHIMGVSESNIKVLVHRTNKKFAYALNLLGIKSSNEA